MPSSSRFQWHCPRSEILLLPTLKPFSRSMEKSGWSSGKLSKFTLKESSEENIEKATAEERLTATQELKALSRELPPHILYLMDLGMELGVIEEVIRNFPSFAYYSLDGNIKPVVEFLLDLGVPKSDIPTTLSKRPQICGFSLSENVIPTMTFLEKFGVGWARNSRHF